MTPARRGHLGVGHGLQWAHAAAHLPHKGRKHIHADDVFTSYLFVYTFIYLVIHNYYFLRLAWLFPGTVQPLRYVPRVYLCGEERWGSGFG